MAYNYLLIESRPTLQWETIFYTYAHTTYKRINLTLSALVVKERNWMLSSQRKKETNLRLKRRRSSLQI